MLYAEEDTPISATPHTKQLVESLHNRLSELAETDGLPPGMLVAILANMNFHHRPMPAQVFSRMDYTRPWEAAEDPEVYAMALRNIRDAEVMIGTPIRVQAGNYWLQYNPLRKCKPERSGMLADVPLRVPFAPGKFNFAKPEVDPEVFRTEKHDDFTVDLIINRYPFAKHHFLWVPDRHAGHEQYLDPDEDAIVLEAAWDLVMRCGDGFSLGYNSMGAHASVNHLHLHGMHTTRGWRFALDDVLARMNLSRSQEITQGYLAGSRWISADENIGGLRDFIREMNARDEAGECVAYNFRMTPQGIACFPRKRQGDPIYAKLLSLSPYTTGQAFSECNGEVISPTPIGPETDKEAAAKDLMILARSMSLN